MVVVILIVAIGTCQLSGTSHAVFTFLAFFHGHSLTILHLSSLSASSMEISGRGFLITFMSSIWKLLLCAIDLTPVILGTIWGKGFFIFGEFWGATPPCSCAPSRPLPGSSHAVRSRNPRRNPLNYRHKTH